MGPRRVRLRGDLCSRARPVTITSAHIEWLRERAQRATSTVVVPTAALRDLLAALEGAGPAPEAPTDSEWPEDWLTEPGAAPPAGAPEVSS